MADQSPGWWEAFDDEALDYLHGEGRQRLRETLAARDQQEQRALYLVGWTVTVVGAAGIFGDLRVSAVDLISILTVLASCGAVLVGLTAAAMFRPRDWGEGVDPSWLARHAGAAARELRGKALTANLIAYGANAQAIRWRARVLTWMYALTLLTSAFIVAIQVAAALSR